MYILTCQLSWNQLHIFKSGIVKGSDYSALLVIEIVYGRPPVINLPLIIYAHAFNITIYNVTIGKMHLTFSSSGSAG